jgi:hypothetical protein
MQVEKFWHATIKAGNKPCGASSAELYWKGTYSLLFTELCTPREKVFGESRTI